VEHGQDRLAARCWSRGGESCLSGLSPKQRCRGIAAESGATLLVATSLHSTTRAHLRTGASAAEESTADRPTTIGRPPTTEEEHGYSREVAAP